MSFFLREVISEAGAVKDDAAPSLRAHSVCGVSTFFRNWFISKVLEATTWRSNSVFASFYFKDILYIFEGLWSLGLFVAAGNVFNLTLFCFGHINSGDFLFCVGNIFFFFSLGLVVLALEPHR